MEKGTSKRYLGFNTGGNGTAQAAPGARHIRPRYDEKNKHKGGKAHQSRACACWLNDSYRFHKDLGKCLSFQGVEFPRKIICIKYKRVCLSLSAFSSFLLLLITLVRQFLKVPGTLRLSVLLTGIMSGSQARVTRGKWHLPHPLTSTPM